MGLFAPWFLAGLAGLALPLYLHLLKQLKSPPKPVPSLMLFESRTLAPRIIAGSIICCSPCDCWFSPC